MYLMLCSLFLFFLSFFLSFSSLCYKDTGVSDVVLANVVADHAVRSSSNEDDEGTNGNNVRVCLPI